MIKARKAASKGFLILSCILVSLTVWIPLWFLATGALMGKGELSSYISPVFQESEHFARWVLLPQYPTLQPLVELLLDTPSFFTMFWNSCLLVFPALLGQLVLGTPAAWGFARFSFPGKRILFFLYILLMLMPFQVTMVSSYLTLDFFNLMDTRLAVILPAVFSTFPVFLSERCFAAIPASMAEAAALDGAGELKLFWKIGLPLGMPGVMAAMVLGFLELYSAIEQPMTFLKDPSRWPLSLYLPDIAESQLGLAMVSSVVMLIPAVLVFLFGQKDLEQGIRVAGLKG